MRPLSLFLSLYPVSVTVSSITLLRLYPAPPPLSLSLSLSLKADAPGTVVPVDAIPDGTMGLDIGPDTMDTFHNELAGNGSQDSNGSRTVVWNGPMGVSSILVYRFTCYRYSSIDLGKTEWQPIQQPNA